jgi:multicomponent Na+:H+ antiporter subunit C
MEIVQAIAIGALFGIGLYQLLRRNVIRSAIGLVIISNAINLFLLSAGAYEGLVPAYANLLTGQRSDALPQALILTAIVISFGFTAFILALAYRADQVVNSDDLDAMTSTDQL